jgi:type III secretion protein T
MPELAAPILSFVLAMGIAAARWMPTVILVPIFGSFALSASIRAAVVLALALPVAPALAPALQGAPPAMPVLFWIVAKEVGVGLIIAAALAIPLWAIEAAGAYIDYQRGANPQALDPSASSDASSLGALLQRCTCVYLMHAGAFHELLRAVYASFGAWPPLASSPSIDAQSWQAIETLVAALSRYALLLALPYLFALAFVEAAFAVVSRISPRFPAYIAALPFKSLVTLLLVALLLPNSIIAAHGIVVEHTSAVVDAVRRASPNGE